MLTRLKFREWSRFARRNERIVYYRGYLAKDRGVEDRHMRTDDQHDVSQLADAVYEAAMKGTVLLFQKRTGNMTFDYYAVSTGPRSFNAGRT
jgi:hypothetical protein